MSIATTIASCVAAIVLTVERHNTAVSVGDRAAPALLNTLEAHAVLSDADRAVWESFGSGEAQLIGPGQDYQDDITTAGQNLAQLAALTGTTGVASRQLQTLNGQLVNYQSLVEQADATHRSAAASTASTGSGDELGYAYLRYASKSLRDPQGGLLAGIQELKATKREALKGQKAATWTSPWLLLAYAAVALLVLASLVHAQRFLRGRFRRRISPPLLLATTLAVGTCLWLGVVTVRADRAYATAHEVQLARLDGIWRAETRRIDVSARKLRADAVDNSARPRAAGASRDSRGLEVAKAQPARQKLDSSLAEAADTGGLLIGLPIAAVTIAALAFLGLKPRLDEYRA